MRITETMLNTTIIKSINESKAYLGKIQQILSTGKIINKPSDNPLLISRVLDLKGRLRNIEQYQKNLNLASIWINSTLQAFTGIGELLNNAKMIALRESNATSTPDSQRISAEEVDNLKKKLLNIANTYSGGRYIFSGTKTRTPSFTETGAYQGDGEEISIQIGERQTITINAPGNKVFKQDKDLFKVLSDLKDALENNNTQGISKQIDEIEACMRQIHRWEGEFGGKAHWIEIFENRLKDQEIEITKFLSNTEDADITKVSVELQSASMAYQAALAAASKILQATMLQFFQ